MGSRRLLWGYGGQITLATARNSPYPLHHGNIVSITYAVCTVIPLWRAATQRRVFFNRERSQGEAFTCNTHRKLYTSLKRQVLNQRLGCQNQFPNMATLMQTKSAFLLTTVACTTPNSLSTFRVREGGKNNGRPHCIQHKGQLTSLGKRAHCRMAITRLLSTCARHVTTKALPCQGKGQGKSLDKKQGQQ